MVTNPDDLLEEYIYLLCAALRVWDDVYDEDYPVTKDDITIHIVKLSENGILKFGEDCEYID